VPRHYVRLAPLAAPLLIAALSSLAACGHSADSAVPPALPAASSSSTHPTPILGADGGAISPAAGAGSLGPGFVTPTAPPPPGGTMTPSPRSWTGVHVPAGYTAALLSTDDSQPARNLATAVKRWASRNAVDLTVVAAHDPTSYLADIQKAVDLHTDLVISAGDALAEPLAVVTSSWLDQRFLLLGAELAEPTYNVTAAVWPGTSARGGGSGSAWQHDASTFTAERAGRALDAGVAAVLQGYSGYVVQVD
jgi:predicted small lipoprotein YifL